MISEDDIEVYHVSRKREKERKIGISFFPNRRQSLIIFSFSGLGLDGRLASRVENPLFSNR